MTSVAMRKGSEIEACPEGDGFKGAWFRAILEAIPKKPARKFTVKFLDLEDEDGSSLIETAFQKFLRPIPPENLFSKDEFEEGSLVEAKHRDGWWIGVFIRKLEDQYLVYFDSPPDLISFKRKQLRQHFDWSNGNNWVRPQIKKLKKRSSFSCGTIVEVMEERKEVVWVEAIVVKEMEDGESFLVKSCKNLSWNEEMKPKRMVGLARIRCVPSLLAVESYKLMDPVEVYLNPGWSPGLVTEILCEKQYKVVITATEEVSVFEHSELRPSLESRSFTLTGEPSLAQGSRDELIVNTGQEMTSREKTLEQSMRNQNGFGSESTGRKTKESPYNQALGCSVMNGNTPSLTKEAVPPVTLSLGIASTRENKASEDDYQKRKRQENISSVGNGEETRAKKTPMVLPFEKKLPIWKAVESMEVFKQVPQSPHFKPLVETQEESREMSAVGMMFTYSALLEEVKTLQLDTPLGTVIGLSNSFVMLEKHGFDIKAPQSRIQKLLSLREKQVKKMEERKSVEKRIAEKESEKAENKRKFLELQRLDEEVDKEIAQMKSNAAMIEQELNDVQRQFQSTFQSPQK